MATVGVRDFRGGQTTSERVGAGDRAFMAKISGYHYEKGYLRPENMVSRFNADGGRLSGTTPEQTPFAWVTDAVTRVIARDADEKPRCLDVSGATWTTAGEDEEVIDVLAESLPLKFGSLLVYCTGGSDAKMMSYEPDSSGTKVRPLSFKAPTNYDTDAKPAGAHSGITGQLELFNCEEDGDVGAWTEANTGTSVDNTPEDSTMLTMASTTPASQQSFTIDLGSTGVDPTDCPYLMLDICIHSDQQEYTETGLFVNDDTLWPSGYELVLWDDQSCAGNEIVRLTIPQCLPQSKLHRIVWNIGTQTTAIKSISVETASYFAAPASGKTHTVQVWSQTLTIHWYYAGNCLLAAEDFQESPWAEDLPEATGTGTSAVVLQEFPDSLAADDWVPRMPFVRYCYSFLGKNVLGQSAYKHMLSNPSEFCGRLTGSPWGYHTVTAAPPLTDVTGTGELVTDDYGDYVTYVLLYRQVFDGVDWGESLFAKALAIPTTDWVTCTQIGSTNTIGAAAHGLSNGNPVRFRTTHYGIDAAATYFVVNKATNTFQISTAVGGTALDITGSSTYVDSFKPSIAWADKWHSCTMTDSGDTVTCTGHQLVVGEAIEFSSTTGGVEADRAYYVSAETDANTFQFSEKRGGGAFAITADGSNSFRLVNHEDALPEINTYLVPHIVEANHDYASSARYATVWKGRIIAACLDWDETNSEWDRPTAIQISNQDDTDEKRYSDYCGISSYPTTTDDDTLPTDGTELDHYAQTGAIVRGLLAREEILYVFLDNEFFTLAGDPANGIQFDRVDAIGCDTARSIADCRRAIIWLSGDDFYAYAGGLAEPIGKPCIDPSLIDLTYPHNAVYSDDYYRFYCYYDGEYTILTYSLRDRSWRTRSTDAYTMVGMCVPSAGGTVYGVKSVGDCLSVFGSTTEDYGATSNIAVREVDTQYMDIAEDGRERGLEAYVLEPVTAESSIDVTLLVRTRGSKAATDTMTVTLDSTKTLYRDRLDGSRLKGRSAKLEFTYSGSTAPDLQFMGVDVPPADTTAGQ